MGRLCRESCVPGLQRYYNVVEALALDQDPPEDVSTRVLSVAIAAQSARGL